MAASIFQDAVKQLQASIAETKSLLAFLKSANHFRPRAAEVLNYQDWDDMDTQVKALATEYMNQKDYNIEVAFNGLMVSLSSSFEQFVRRLIRESVGEICRRAQRYDNLQEKVRRQHLLRSGHALATIMEPPVEAGYDYDLICKNLGNCYAGGDQLTLNASVFYIRLAGMTAETITEAFDRIDVSIDWDEFGRDGGMRRALGISGTREAKKETIDWLEAFTKKRNKIAHTGVAGYLTKLTEIEESVAFFEAFAPVLARAAESGIRKSK
jgi:hypothetical protein